jgi:hypothetical protein
MAQRPVLIGNSQDSPAEKPDPLTKLDHPPPEDHLGGGDICSLQEQPSTDDDKPLD